MLIVNSHCCSKTHSAVSEPIVYLESQKCQNISMYKRRSRHICRGSLNEWMTQMLCLVKNNFMSVLFYMPMCTSIYLCMPSAVITNGMAPNKKFIPICDPLYCVMTFFELKPYWWMTKCDACLKYPLLSNSKYPHHQPKSFPNKTSGQAWLIRSHSLARFCFELSGNSN